MRWAHLHHSTTEHSKETDKPTMHNAACNANHHLWHLNLALTYNTRNSPFRRNAAQQEVNLRTAMKVELVT